MNDHLPFTIVFALAMRHSRMAYTYRKTNEEHPKYETLVHYDGVNIARIYQFDSGPQSGQRGWFGKWSGPGNSGRADSLEE